MSTEQNNEEAEENSELTENNELIKGEELPEIKTTTPKVEVKTQKFQSFPNQNRFVKGGFNGSNFNNKQRPGRAASRGR